MEIEVTNEALHEAISQAFTGDCRYLAGRLKTLADAIGVDDMQRKAIKDMIGHIVYTEFGEHFHRVLAEYLVGETITTVRKE